MVEDQVRGLKILLVIASAVSLVFLLTAALTENFGSSWRRHQKEYARLLAENPTAGGTPVRFEVRLRQNYLEGLRRVDRCVTCHTGIDNAAAIGFSQPLTTHPGDLLKSHPPDKFGCTVCHQGQGRATTLPDAHGVSQQPGEEVHWPEPLLSGQMTYTACGKCHYENDLYGGQSDLYGQMRPIPTITLGELSTSVGGAENVARGKQLVIKNGCLGCHSYRGRGGTLGPDITHVGDKTVHDFDFTHVQDGEHTVLGWLTAHFLSPSAVVPDTLMPDMGLSPQQARDLAACMISLKRKTAPAEYTPLPAPVDRTPADGGTLYAMYCSACHGADGVGAVARESETPGAIDRPRELLTPSLRNSDTLAVASDDYLRQIIRHGRSGTSMLGWAEEGGLTDDEINRLVGFIRSWQAPGAPGDRVLARRGNPSFGRALYRSRCTGCHGINGRGGVGLNLRSPSMLAIASDEFLRQTIVNGRPNTAMPSWKDLDTEEVADLIAYLRSWQRDPAGMDAVLARLAHRSADAGASLRIGRILYRANCATCHGNRGEGALGPSLRTEEFLSLVDDRYLYSAIVRGRPGTAMPAWKQLSEEDVADLIRHLRSWNDSPRRRPSLFVAQGDWDRGRILFEGICSGCHGLRAEGGVGPQLANPVFLESADDTMLREWINYGKTGTAMLGMLRGEQGLVKLNPSQVEDIITWLRYQNNQQPVAVSRPGMGIVPYGRETYLGVCSGCHGRQGQGLTGPALSNPGFLRAASDGFLAATIALGRDGTEMRAMGHGLQGAVELDAEDLANTVAFIRHWEYDPPGEDIARREVVGADRYDGKDLFAGYCAGCHGAAGKGGWAPALNNPQFLAAASDGFLQATIARGRVGTAMRSFGRGGGGLAPLAAEQIENVVAYIRSWEKK